MTKKLKRILYIDDDEDILIIAKLALEKIGGFCVQTYKDGTEIVSYAEKFKPDVILLDVMMPVINGSSALELIKKNDSLKDIPVIFMTAKERSGELSHYLSTGVAGIIPKPFDPMSLSNEISILWRQLNDKI